MDKQKDQLYRIYFYDCPPLKKKLHHPISNQSLDLAKTPTAIFRNSFHQEIIQMRNVALRLGYLDEDNGAWKIRDQKKNKKVISGQLDPKELEEADFVYHASQKGVDMKIGLDIASLAYKRLVDRIVLIAGDSDFVPAAKLARREGIEFVLDPMRNHIRLDLREHIDGLKTTLPPQKTFVEPPILTKEA
ncbi:MAG: NYN domain-containing protein [Methylococcaceae bacterium]|nr:NYN domain-containing protein [Methylococcaceae bacterium]